MDPSGAGSRTKSLGPSLRRVVRSPLPSHQQSRRPRTDGPTRAGPSAKPSTAPSSSRRTTASRTSKPSCAASGSSGPYQRTRRTCSRCCRRGRPGTAPSKVPTMARLRRLCGGSRRKRSCCLRGRICISREFFPSFVPSFLPSFLPSFFQPPFPLIEPPPSPRSAARRLPAENPR